MYHLIADPTLPKCPECCGKLFTIVADKSESIICRDCGEEWQSENEIKQFVCDYKKYLSRLSLLNRWHTKGKLA